MTMATNGRPTKRSGRGIVLGVVALAAVAAGLFGSIFGPAYSAAVGVILAVVGVIGVARGAHWARFLLLIGGGLVVGSALYVLLGILTSDGSASAAGTARPWGA